MLCSALAEAAPATTANDPSPPPPPPVAVAAPLGRQRVAVVHVGFDAGVVEAARELFGQRLVEGLTAAQFDVVAAGEVATTLAARNPSLPDCRQPSCYPAVAEALGVGYLVTSQVAVASKTYDITLELVNGRTGNVIGTNREHCDICGVEEAAEKMGLAASALRARLEALTKTPARFIVRSRPPGAAATLDGQRAGVTPLDRELPGGPHKLQLAAPGYDPLERTFIAVSGVDETLDLDLVRLPTKFPYRAAGWTSLVIGAALIVGGIWALSLDGKEIACAPSDRDIFGHCPNVRDSRVGGAILMGAGVATATLGGFWLYLGSGSREATAPRSVALIAGGAF
ncbi:MAG TPA: PEGA domain-containing protein [Polyangia bacterium]|nr:PEGA domain-containing protein [Polyangia bacterium]